MCLCIFTANLIIYSCIHVYLGHHLSTPPTCLPASMLWHNPNTLAYLDLQLHLFSFTYLSISPYNIYLKNQHRCTRIHYLHTQQNLGDLKGALAPIYLNLHAYMYVHKHLCVKQTHSYTLHTYDTWVISRARWRAASAVPYSPSLNLPRSISRSGMADHRRSELVLSVS